MFVNVSKSHQAIWNNNNGYSNTGVTFWYAIIFQYTQERNTCVGKHI